MPMKWDLGHVPIIILIVIPLFPIVFSESLFTVAIIRDY